MGFAARPPHTRKLVRVRLVVIAQAAPTLRNSLNPEFLKTATFVPVPPTRVVGDPLCDDRMTQVILSLDPAVDARELVCQLETMHETNHQNGLE
jgi:hypothetical protein